jgi:hypothetical protein
MESDSLSEPANDKYSFLLEVAETTYNKMGVYHNKSMMESVFANCLQRNVGGRIKIMIENMYFLSFIPEARPVFNKIYQFINQSERLMTLLEQHIGYPGLLKNLFLLYFSVQNRRAFEQLSNSPPDPALPKSSRSSCLKTFIAKWQDNCNNIAT